LEDGLYYYSAPKNKLILLRRGDFCLHRAGEPVRLTFFITAIFFRVAIKYLKRAFRYVLMDAGHITENLDLVLKSEGIKVELDYDFSDQYVNSILGLDQDREVCLAVGRVLGGKAPARTEPIEPAEASLAQPSRIYKKEFEFPEIKDAYKASCQIISPTELSVPGPEDLGVKVGAGKQLSGKENCPEQFTFSETVIRRRSKRNFVPTGLSYDCFDWLTSLLCTGPGQTVQPVESSLQIGILADRVEGLEPGFYLLDRTTSSCCLVKSGHFLEEMARACLDQVWVGRASLNFLFMVNLETMEQTWGPRGYRHALITAGRLGHRIYLGATAAGLGALAIGALYDSETADLLELNKKSRLLYLVEAGPVKG
jgi:nitroreductase